MSLSIYDSCNGDEPTEGRGCDAARTRSPGPQPSGDARNEDDIKARLSLSELSLSKSYRECLLWSNNGCEGMTLSKAVSTLSLSVGNNAAEGEGPCFLKALMVLQVDPNEDP